MRLMRVKWRQCTPGVRRRDLMLRKAFPLRQVRMHHRGEFLQGRKRFMLYTGRAHFFMRHHIKGAKHLIMFGLPEHAEFYPELLNMLSWRPKHTEDEEYQLDISTPSSCLNLFTKYEAHNLERIVGSKHSDRMIKGEKNTFLFQS